MPKHTNNWAVKIVFAIFHSLMRKFMKLCAISMDSVNYRLIITCNTLYLLTVMQHAIYNLICNYSYYKNRFQPYLFRLPVGKRPDFGSQAPSESYALCCNMSVRKTSGEMAWYTHFVLASKSPPHVTVLRIKSPAGWQGSAPRKGCILALLCMQYKL